MSPGLLEIFRLLIFPRRRGDDWYQGSSLMADESKPPRFTRRALAGRNISLLCICPHAAGQRNRSFVAICAHVAHVKRDPLRSGKIDNYLRRCNTPLTTLLIGGTTPDFGDWFNRLAISRCYGP
jgi:hypothetical protein